MLNQAQLRLLAARRVAHGEQMARDHVRDGTNCCRRCGRPFPCDGRRLGVALVAYYRNLAVTREEQPWPHGLPTASSLGLPCGPDDPLLSTRLYLARTRSRGRLTRWLVRHAPR